MQIKFDANKKRLDTTPAFGLLVQGENLAESIQITGPKMVGALDLSQLRVAVRMTSAEYETTVEKTLEQTTDGDTITLIWEVDKQFTGSPGKVDVMLVGYGGNEEVIKITSSGMVVQEDRTFDTAPPESTWEQILQQMQDFATQAYESKTAAANSAAEAAASQKVAEEKAKQATNAASEAVKAAETAATDAAAQAAAKTEQQIRQYADDRYARPLVTKTGPAASLEVYPDKLSNLKVYANGFTQQAGTGDPSPKNVRAIANGGYNKKSAVPESGWATANGVFYAPYVVADADSNFTVICQIGSNVGQELVSTTDFVSAATGKDYAVGFNLRQGDGAYGRMYVKAPFSSVGDFQNWLSQTKPFLCYVVADESDATGLYAPIILTSGEYRATCLPLTAPICEGDSVVSWVKSGCDAHFVFDGSADEGWALSSAGADPTTGGKRFYCRVDGLLSGGYANYLVSSTSTATGGENVFYASAGESAAPTQTTIYVRLGSETTVEQLQSALAANPIEIWLRSTNYTESADIPVSLETHQQAVLVLDGTEGWMANAGSAWCYSKGGTTPGKSADGTVVCSQFKGRANTSYIDTNWATVSTTGYVVIKSDAYTSDTEALSAYLAAQYAAGTPVTIVYQLATPITYAHEAVVLPALPDDTGKVTITGQSGGTVTVVFNKSIIKEIAEIKAAMLAMGANLSM